MIIIINAPYTFIFLYLTIFFLNFTAYLPTITSTMLGILLDSSLAGDFIGK